MATPEQTPAFVKVTGNYSFYLDLNFQGEPPFSSSVLSLQAFTKSDKKVPIVISCQWYRDQAAGSTYLDSIKSNRYVTDIQDIGYTLRAQVVCSSNGKKEEAIVEYGPVLPKPKLRADLENLLSAQMDLKLPVEIHTQDRNIRVKAQVALTPYDIRFTVTDHSKQQSDEFSLNSLNESGSRAPAKGPIVRLRYSLDSPLVSSTPESLIITLTVQDESDDAQKLQQFKASLNAKTCHQRQSTSLSFEMEDRYVHSLLLLSIRCLAAKHYLQNSLVIHEGAKSLNEPSSNTIETSNLTIDTLVQLQSLRQEVTSLNRQNTVLNQEKEIFQKNILQLEEEFTRTIDTYNELLRGKVADDNINTLAELNQSRCTDRMNFEATLLRKDHELQERDEIIDRLQSEHRKLEFKVEALTQEIDLLRSNIPNLSQYENSILTDLRMLEGRKSPFARLKLPEKENADYQDDHRREPERQKNIGNRAPLQDRDENTSRFTIPNTDNEMRELRMMNDMLLVENNTYKVQIDSLNKEVATLKEQASSQHITELMKERDNIWRDHQALLSRLSRTSSKDHEAQIAVLELEKISLKHELEQAKKKLTQTSICEADSNGGGTSSLMSETSKLRERVEQLEKENVRLKDKNQSYSVNSFVDSDEMQKDALRCTKQELGLRDIVKRLTKNIEKLQDDKQKLEKRRDKHLNQNDSLKEELKSMEKQLHSATKTLETISERKKLVEDEVKLMQQEHSKLGEYKETLDGQLRSLAEKTKLQEHSRQQLNDTSSSEVAHYKRLTHGSEQQLSELKKVYEKRSSELQRLQSKVLSIDQEVKAATATLEERRREAAARTQECKTWEQEARVKQFNATVKQAQAQQEKAEEDLGRTRKQMQTLDRELEQNNQARKQKEQDATQLEERLKCVELEVTRKENALQSKQALCESLGTKQKRMEEQLKEAEAQNCEISRLIEEKQNYLKRQSEELSSLQSRERDLTVRQTQQRTSLAQVQSGEKKLDEQFGKLKQVEQRNTELKGQLEVAEMTASRLMTQIKDAQSQATTLESEHRAALDDISAIQQKKNSAEKEYSSIKSLVTFLQGKYQTEKQQHDALVGSIQSTTQSISTSRDKSQQLVQELNQLEDQLKDLTHQRAESLRAIHEAQVELADTQRGFDAIQTELKELSHEKHQTADATIDMRETVQGLRIELDHLSREKTQLHNGLQQVKATVQQSKGVLSQLQCEQQILEQQIPQLRDTIQTLEHRHATLSADRNVKTDEYDSLKSTVHSLNEKKVSLAKDQEQVTSELETLAWDCSQKKENLTNRREELLSLKQKNQMLVDQFDELTISITTKEQSLSVLQQKLKSAELQIASSRQQRDQQLADNLRVQEELQRAQAEIEDMRNELKYTDEQKPSIEEDVQHRREEAAQIQTELDQLTTRVVALTDEKNIVLRTEQELSEILIELKECQTERQSKAGELQRAIQEVQEIIDEQTRMRESLEQLLPERKVETEELQKKICALDSELEHHKRRYSERKELASRYQTDYELLEKEITDAKQLLDAIQKDKGGLDREIAQLKARGDRHNSSLLQQLSEINGRSATRRMELEEKRHKLTMIEEDIREVASDLKDYEGLRSKLKERLEQSNRERKIMEGRVFDKEAAISKAKYSLISLDNKSKTLESELKRQEKLIETKESKLKAVLEENGVVDSSSGLQYAVLEKERECKRKQTEISSLKRAVDKEKSERQAAESLTAVQEEELSQLKRLLKGKQSNTHSDQTVIVAELRNELQEKTDVTDELRQQTCELSRRLEQRSNELQQRSGEYEVLKQEVGDMREEFSGFESRCKAELKHMSETLELRNEKIERLETRKEELSSELVQAMEDLGKKSIEAEKLKQAMKDFREEFVKSEARHRGEVQRQKEGLKEREEIGKALQERNEVLQESLDRLNRQMVERGEELLRNSQELETVKAEVARLHQDFQEENSLLKQKVRARESDLTALECSCKNLKEELRHQYEQTQRAQAESQSFDRQLKEIRSQASLNGQQEEALRYERRVTEITAEWEGKTETLQRALREADERAEKEHESWERAMNDLEGKSKRSESSLQGRIDSLTKEMRRKEELLDIAQARGTIVEKLFDELKANYVEIEDEGALPEKVAELLTRSKLTKSGESLESRKESRTNELEHLVRELQAQNRSSSQMMEQLIKTNHNLMKEHSNLMEENAQLYEELETCRDPADYRSNH